MKTRGLNFIKNAMIALLLGYFVAHAVPWVDIKGAVTGGFLAAELVMFYLTAYDEVIRQRKRRKR